MVEIVEALSGGKLSSEMKVGKVMNEAAIAEKIFEGRMTSLRECELKTRRRW